MSQVAYHYERAQRLDSVWALVWKRAFKESYGRDPAIHDYRITAIGDAQIAEHHKRVLRHCAYSVTKHNTLAYAHAYAAGQPSWRG